MSKRDTSQATEGGRSIFIKDLQDLGYIPEGVVNWAALMGWSFDDRTEFFCMKDLIDKFSLEHLNPAPAAINYTKLDYFNGLHIRNLAPEDLAHRLAPFITGAGLRLEERKLLSAVPIIQPRLVTLDDVVPVAGFLFKDDVTPTPAELVGDRLTPQESAKIAREARDIIRRLPGINKELTEPPLRNLVEVSGLQAGQVFGILRVAVTGQKNSPPLFECMEIIGKDKVLERLNSAAETLEKM